MFLFVCDEEDSPLHLGSSSSGIKRRIRRSFYRLKRRRYEDTKKIRLYHCEEMKLIVLLCVVALISVDCRPVMAPPSHRRLLLPRPLLVHLGEEFSLQLAGGSSSSSVNQALLELTQRPLQAGVKEKRSEEPPISLDLTFHLLREVLQMARAEQIAQQADSNRRMMDAFGR